MHNTSAAIFTYWEPDKRTKQVMHSTPVGGYVTEQVSYGWVNKLTKQFVVTRTVDEIMTKANNV